MNLYFKSTIEDYLFQGQPITLELDVTAHLTHYDPGNTYGPPENCYPPEGGEIEDIEATVTQTTPPVNLEEVQKDFDQRINEFIDQLQTQAENEPLPEPDYDDYDRY